jgi:4-alpha-glucanotransferase
VNAPARLRVLDQRRGGVLLHATALQGSDGAGGRGAIGAAARAFIDWLAAAGFSVWQMLPLGPVGISGSPYWVRSDMAAEPSLIDPRELPDVDRERADYQRFRSANADLWLEDYVLFEALSERFGSPWWQWPDVYRSREPQELARFAEASAALLEQRRLEQWHFDWQWRALRRYASERGVCLFGDLPIYVAPDSAAAWSRREQFQLDAEGKPALLAGVPPDYFSADGQLWGNPLYDWQQARRDQFAFWRRRLAGQLRRLDLVRIDHFRGLAAYWGVPSGARSAREGKWYRAPGVALFESLQAQFPDLPVVAEDLGLITPDVEALRRRFGFPGMRVLQFGFDGGADNPHLPHNHVRDAVVYSGTHDNDTTLGWSQKLTSAQAERVQFYLNCNREHIAEAVLRACLASVGQLAVIPMQDVLRLDSSARFNLPGTTRGNWSWRLPPGSLTASLAQHFRALNRRFGRSDQPVDAGDKAPPNYPAS